MVVPIRAILPRIVVQAGHYQVKNWQLAKPSSHVRLTLSEGYAFRKAHEWCVARNDEARAKRERTARPVSGGKS